MGTRFRSPHSEKKKQNYKYRNTNPTNLVTGTQSLTSHTYHNFFTAVIILFLAFSCYYNYYTISLHNYYYFTSLHNSHLLPLPPPFTLPFLLISCCLKGAARRPRFADVKIFMSRNVTISSTCFVRKRDHAENASHGRQQKLTQEGLAGEDVELVLETSKGEV